MRELWNFSFYLFIVLVNRILVCEEKELEKLPCNIISRKANLSGEKMKYS